MPPSHKHVGFKMLAKIKIYILTRAELFLNLCYEIPCTTRFIWRPHWFPNLLFMPSLLPSHQNETKIKKKLTLWSLRLNVSLESWPLNTWFYTGFYIGVLQRQRYVFFPPSNIDFVLVFVFSHFQTDGVDVCYFDVSVFAQDWKIRKNNFSTGYLLY